MDKRKRRHSEMIGSEEDELLPVAKRFKGEEWVVVEDWLALGSWFESHSLDVGDVPGVADVRGSDLSSDDGVVPANEDVFVKEDNVSDGVVPEHGNVLANEDNPWLVVCEDGGIGFGDGVESMEVENGSVYGGGLWEESSGIGGISFAYMSFGQAECGEHDVIFICEDCLCFTNAIAGESGDDGRCSACMKKRIKSLY